MGSYLASRVSAQTPLIYAKPLPGVAAYSNRNRSIRHHYTDWLTTRAPFPHRWTSSRRHGYRPICLSNRPSLPRSSCILEAISFDSPSLHSVTHVTSSIPTSVGPHLGVTGIDPYASIVCKASPGAAVYSTRHRSIHPRYTDLLTSRASISHRRDPIYSARVSTHTPSYGQSLPQELQFKSNCLI
jgi:hypothetical protein